MAMRGKKKVDRWSGWEPIYISHPRYGKVKAGYLKDGIFAWEINPKRHLLTKYNEGIAKDADVIDMLVSKNLCRLLRVHDKKSNNIYELWLREFMALKTEINYPPFGRQYVVPKEKFRVITSQGEYQLPLWNEK